MYRHRTLDPPSHGPLRNILGKPNMREGKKCYCPLLFRFPQALFKHHVTRIIVIIRIVIQAELELVKNQGLRKPFAKLFDEHGLI